MSTQRLFISHASEDEAVVNRIVQFLEANGVPCWISSRDIPPRSIYADAIAEGMDNCSACVVIVSSASSISKAVKRELELASHLDKPFIPIRIDRTEPVAGVAYYLRNTQWIDYLNQGDHALIRITGQGNPTTPQRASASSSNSPGRLTLVSFGLGAMLLSVMMVGGFYALEMPFPLIVFDLMFFAAPIVCIAAALLFWSAANLRRPSIRTTIMVSLAAAFLGGMSLALSYAFLIQGAGLLSYIEAYQISASIASLAGFIPIGDRTKA